MPGALNLTEPRHLLQKLEHELQGLTADHSDSYSAINALRDAYHLREWLWHDRLEQDPALQAMIMGAAVDEAAWNAWVNRSFADFPIIRELCNGSKHFESGATIKAAHRAGWDSPVPFWDNPESGWDDNGFHVEVTSGRVLSVVALVTRVRFSGFSSHPIPAAGLTDGGSASHNNPARCAHPDRYLHGAGATDRTQQQRTSQAKLLLNKRGGMLPVPQSQSWRVRHPARILPTRLTVVGPGRGLMDDGFVTFSSAFNFAPPGLTCGLPQDRAHHVQQITGGDCC
jgi:hypothetical protein